jgi:Trk K+ transport system NAD-binding subunit
VPADSRIVALYRIADDRAEALQFNVNHHKVLTGKALKDLHHKLRQGVLITAIVRGNTFVIPNGDTVIEGDDSIIVITTHGGISSLDDILR